MNYYSNWHGLKRAITWILRLRKGLLLFSKRRQELKAATLHLGAGRDKQETDEKRETQQNKTTLNKLSFTSVDLNKA